MKIIDYWPFTKEEQRIMEKIAKEMLKTSKKMIKSAEKIIRQPYPDKKATPKQ